MGWQKKNLSIKYSKGTSVLNIKYKDKDKSIIIPVMKKISNAYQEYSKSEQLNSLAQGLSFYEQQIEEMKEKTRLSMIKLQDFSIKNKLGNFKI